MRRETGCRRHVSVVNEEKRKGCNAQQQCHGVKAISFPPELERKKHGRENSHEQTKPCKYQEKVYKEKKRNALTWNANCQRQTKCSQQE